MARDPRAGQPARPSTNAAVGAVPAGNLRLLNTLTRRLDAVEPRVPGIVRMYTCSPTVYRYVHVGNLRTDLTDDWIRRALEADGRTKVRMVQNITDVGHIRQDAVDRGEDMMIAAALAEGKTPAEIAAFYTSVFMDDIALNIVELRDDRTVGLRLSRANHMRILRAMWDKDPTVV